MKKNLLMCVLLGLFLVGLSCASKRYMWRSQPNMQEASNEYYTATISPIYIFNGYKGFTLYIHNKSPGDIDVDWDNTLYVYEGKKKGGFIFQKMRSGDRIDTPSIISGSMFSEDIFPAKLATYSTIALSTIYEPMGPGENGVFLTVKVGGKVVTETLTLNFTQDKSK